MPALLVNTTENGLVQPQQPNRHCKPAIVTLTVLGTVVTGQAKWEIDAPNINGTVRENGTIGATIGWQPLIGKFVDDGLEGTFKSGDCVWKMLLKRTK